MHGSIKIGEENRLKKSISLLMVLFGILLLVACSNDENNDKSEVDSTEEAASNEELTKMKVAYMPNYASMNAVVAGINTGAFEEQGIEVELVEFADGPTIIAAMESGSIDVGYIGPGAHVLAIQGSADIFAFAHLGNADEVIGNKENGVREISDLKGKTIAVASGTSSETILNMTLNEAGLTEEDVKLMDMDASAIVTAMISGSVDAAATWSPNTTAIKEEMGDNAIMLSNNVRYADQFPSIASWVVNPKYAEENHDLLVKFTKGLYGGMDYRVENLDEVAKWSAEVAGLDAESVKKETGDGDWITSDDLVEMIENGDIDIFYEVQQENFMTEERLTEDELVPVSDYVLFDIMKEAAE